MLTSCTCRERKRKRAGACASALHIQSSEGNLWHDWSDREHFLVETRDSACMVVKSAVLLDSSMMKTNMMKNSLIMRMDIHISTEFRLQRNVRDMMKVFICKGNCFEQDSEDLCYIKQLSV